jgi:hypothetical protein
MSHQEAKIVAHQVIRDLLTKYPPGFFVMIIRALTRALRSTSDITIYADRINPRLEESDVVPVDTDQLGSIKSTRPGFSPEKSGDLAPGSQSG